MGHLGPSAITVTSAMVPVGHVHSSVKGNVKSKKTDKVKSEHFTFIKPSGY